MKRLQCKAGCEKECGYALFNFSIPIQVDEDGDICDDLEEMYEAVQARMEENLPEYFKCGTCGGPVEIIERPTT